MKPVFTKLAAAAALCAAFALPTAAMAQVHIDLNLFANQPPPPVRVEAVPAPRAGYLWAPGYWDWQNQKHVWRGGHWEKQRAGYVYEHPTWVQENGAWRIQKAEWKQAQREEKRDRKDDKHEGRGEHCPPGHEKKGEC